MALAPSSYIKTTTAVDTRTRDQLSFPFTARPQAMTVYVRFVEMGAILLTTIPRIIGQGINDSNGAGTWLIFVESTGFYAMQHWRNGIVGSVLTAAPSVGQKVELRGVLNGNGSVQLHQSINGGAETSATASAAKALATVWSDTNLYIGSGPQGSTPAPAAFRNVHIVAGVKTMQEMRIRAGTD